MTMYKSCSKLLLICKGRKRTPKDEGDHSYMLGNLEVE